MLFSMDSFSEEDMMQSGNPLLHGRNLAAAGMSDISASGGKALFYAHSLEIDGTWTEKYIKEFSRGVAEVLKETGCSFMGGDFGEAERWHYTAAVIGVPFFEPVKRTGAEPGDIIYITGRVGAANLEAFLELEKRKIFFKTAAKLTSFSVKIRKREAGLAGRYASSCIDTSDGLYSGLMSIAGLNGTGFIIDRIPYCRTGLAAASVFKLPAVLLALGECGEYELLFTVRAEDEEEFEREAENENMQFYKIGKVTESGRYIIEKGRRINIGRLSISARDFRSRKKYFTALVKELDKL